MEHILSILIFFPAIAALMAFVVEKNSIRVYGITVTAIEFMLSAYMLYMFDGTMQGCNLLSLFH